MLCLRRSLSTLYWVKTLEGWQAIEETAQLDRMVVGSKLAMG